VRLCGAGRSMWPLAPIHSVVGSPQDGGRHDMNALRALFAGLAMAIGVASSASADPSGAIMVYTSQPSDQMAKVVEAFRAAHPAIKVELFRSGTTEVMNKLQAEFAAGRPQADVVLIADAVAM